MSKNNKFKETIEFVGLSYKKEMTKLLLINLAFLLALVLLFVFLKNFIYSIFLLLGLLFLDFFLLTQYSDKKKQILKNRENELIAIISYFEVYIQNNNNIYQSFAQLIPYCSDWMKEKVETLLKEIDSDKSVQPFINFANNFQQLSTSSLMLSIYQMIDQGENSEQLIQFNIIFDELARARNKEMVEQKEKSLASMATFPLVGTALITVTLTISILSILGDLINVI